MRASASIVRSGSAVASSQDDDLRRGGGGRRGDGLRRAGGEPGDERRAGEACAAHAGNPAEKALPRTTRAQRSALTGRQSP